VVPMVVRVQYVRQRPATLFARREDRANLWRVNTRCHPGGGIVQEEAIIVREARNLGDLERLDHAACHEEGCATQQCCAGGRGAHASQHRGEHRPQSAITQTQVTWRLCVCGARGEIALRRVRHTWEGQKGVLLLPLGVEL
jgi:hypothetical protein